MAQDDPFPQPTPSWVGDFATASANILFSGLAAGITRELKGGSFRDGFTRGALGGLVIYGGKRIAVADFAGAGFIGREVASVGGSMVHNAADGVGTFDRLVLPAGIARVYWSRAQPRNWQIKIDAMTLGWTIYGVVEPKLEFDLGESLSAGGPMFRANNLMFKTPDGERVGGFTAAGVIFLSNVSSWPDSYLRYAEAHERVHVLQGDQLFLTITEPHDDALLRKLPGGKAINRWFDVNFALETVWLIGSVIDRHSDRPWELEANYLAR